jgi:hypothetical protein
VASGTGKAVKPCTTLIPETGSAQFIRGNRMSGNGWLLQDWRNSHLQEHCIVYHAGTKERLNEGGYHVSISWES